MTNINDNKAVSDVLHKWIAAEGARENQRGAKILYEKKVVDGQKGRVIRGFEGVLDEKNLPAKYVSGNLAFWNCGDVVVVLKVPTVIGCRDLTYVVELRCGEWIAEDAYQEVLTWLRRAGSRLAKIRKQERDAWKGEGADVI